MKNLLILLFALLSGTVFASTVKATSSEYTGYGSSIIFTEGNIEFAVYPDGQFDFYYQAANQINVAVGTPNVNISYNAGYNYNPYVQYDDYGAVIQIENVPVYYDYYGRINRAGNVYISYNSLGRVARIGGLYLFYDAVGHFAYFNGYINLRNRNYVYRPWHHYYMLPPVSRCVVYTRPYRAHYAPHRIAYTHYRTHYRAQRNTGRAFYRPADKVTRYNYGSRTAQRRDIAQPARTNASSTRANVASRSSNRPQEIQRSNSRRTSVSNTIPTRSRATTSTSDASRAVINENNYSAENTTRRNSARNTNDIRHNNTNTSSSRKPVNTNFRISSKNSKSTSSSATRNSTTSRSNNSSARRR